MHTCMTVHYNVCVCTPKEMLAHGQYTKDMHRINDKLIMETQVMKMDDVISHVYVP